MNPQFLPGEIQPQKEYYFKNMYLNPWIKLKALEAQC